MDEILHHSRNPGMMIPLQIPTNHGFPWLQSGAGFCPPTVGIGIQELRCRAAQTAKAERAKNLTAPRSQLATATILDLVSEFALDVTDDVLGS